MPPPPARVTQCRRCQERRRRRSLADTRNSIFISLMINLQGQSPANREAAAASAADADVTGAENVAAEKAAAAAGDEMMPGMAFMMDAYEQELKRPIRNVVNGQLPRTLLIQVIDMSFGVVIGSESVSLSKAAFVKEAVRRVSSGRFETW